jgi:hypothetical protein
MHHVILLSALFAHITCHRYDFWPFGDPFIEKRKQEARRTKQAGRRQWYDEDD